MLRNNQIAGFVTVPSWKKYKELSSSFFTPVNMLFFASKVNLVFDWLSNEEASIKMPKY